MIQLNLKKLMENNFLSVTDLANELGVSYKTLYSIIERGTVKPRLAKQLKDLGYSIDKYIHKPKRKARR